MNDFRSDLRSDLLINLRQLLELDRGLGLEWIGKGGLSTASPQVEPLVSMAPAPVPTAPPHAPAPVEAPRAIELLPDTDLTTIASEIARCTACTLCATRSATVPGDGHATAEVMFIGEAPGVEDENHGQPFVGTDGDLLTRMIEAMGLSRSAVFITNMVKCRPPGKRPAATGEALACLGFLQRQIAAIKPKVICTLGNLPLRTLLADESLGLTKVRGQRLDYRGIPLIPTFHPDYLLRNPTAKKPCWDDLKAVLAVLGRTPPHKSGG